MTVFVNAIMYYKVRDATSAVANVDDYGGSARLLAATTLRNVLGTKGRFNSGYDFYTDFVCGTLIKLIKFCLSLLPQLTLFLAKYLSVRERSALHKT